MELQIFQNAFVLIFWSERQISSLFCGAYYSSQQLHDKPL